MKSIVSKKAFPKLGSLASVTLTGQILDQEKENRDQSFAMVLKSTGNKIKFNRLSWSNFMLIKLLL